MTMSVSNIARDYFGPEFRAWPKIRRDPVWMRVTEKIDGTNACVIVHEGRVYAQSRTRLITPEQDNYGFAAWTQENAGELLELGEGYHYGEWWGRGIQRDYGLDDRYFSLFGHWYDSVPPCVQRVPELYRGSVVEAGWTSWDFELMTSQAAPGYNKPEGLVVEYICGRQVLRQKIIINECKGGKG